MAAGEGLQNGCLNELNVELPHRAVLVYFGILHPLMTLIKG